MKASKMMKTAGLFAAAVLVFVTIFATPGVCAPPKKMAIVPFFINSPQDLGFLQTGLFNMLFSRLSDPGKVDVLDRDTVDKVMAEAQKAGEIKGTLNESQARIIGANMGVDYLLFGSLTHFGESVSLDASMVDITGEKPTLTFFKQSNSMGDVIPMVNTFAGDINLKVFNRSIANEMYARPEAQGPQAPGVDQGAGGFISRQQTGTQRFATHLKFSGRINALATGDLNKDGVVQVVTATDYEILIHKLENDKLVVENKLEFSSTNRIIALDIADINQNGYPEIFVTSLNIHRDGLQSFVLEYNGSKYVTLTDDQSYYYRVIDGPNKTRILLGQKSSGHPFHGAIFTMTASGNHYVRDQKLRLPRSTSVLSLAKGSVTTKDAVEYVLINENGRLTVVSDTGAIDWEGNKKFGGTAHYFLLPRNDTDGSYRERIYFNPRILFYDIGDDGKREVFALRNETFGDGNFGRYKRFTKGSLEILSWDGISLSQVSKTRSAPGWISDFALADIDGDGKDELVVCVVGKSKFSFGKTRQTSNIISYKLE